ncbi:MAG TPA: hypothetical protein VIV60_17135, partial [Polyangiaceae bacterium]
MTIAKGNDRTISIEVQTSMAERPKDLVAIGAYAFSQGGTLLDSKPIDKEGNAQLTVPIGDEPQSVRIVLGPVMDAKSPELGELIRRGSIDRHVAVRSNVQGLVPITFEVDPERLRLWLGRRCLVIGTLMKSVISGGVPLRLPVCHAAVDIYEVDPWPLIISVLPDVELARLRELVRNPWPPIDWPFPPQPETDVTVELSADPFGRVSLNPQPLPPRLQARSTRQNAQLPTFTADSLVFPDQLLLAAAAPRPMFERAILAHIDLLRPILCWLFPLRVRKTKLVTVMTDECGHFRAQIWRSIFNPDQPDLYFVARQRIWPGFWVTIYEPKPVACNTWWNYVCGTEVHLVTSHAAAHTCPPCPPIIAPSNWVLFMAIGNTSVWRIHGAN